MDNNRKNKYLRETMVPTTKAFTEQKFTVTNRQNDSDQEDTIRKNFSPLKHNLKKQSPNKIKLRSTYSPGSITNKIITQPPKNNFYSNNYNWNSNSRISGFTGITNKHKSSFSQNIQSKSLTNLHSKLSYLQQCVNKAKKQLQVKNSRKNQYEQLTSINQKAQQESRSDRFKKQKNYIYHTNNSSNDLKATIKIPDISQLITNIQKPKEINGFDFDPYSPRNHNLYYVSSLIRAINEKNSIAKQHVRTSIKILKNLETIDIPSFDQLEQKKLSLKKDEKYKDKKTIIFDLDETLIHCNQNSELPSDIKLTIKLQNGEFTAGINIRPYAMPLLNQLTKKFQLIIFTASHSSYANVVLDYLDPQKKLFQHRLYRQHCYLAQNGMYVKDIRIINRNPAELILVDNAAYSYAFQLENGVPILNYYEGQDFELKALHKYLDMILVTKDVRQLNKKTFKLHHYTKFNNPEELIEQLYMQN